MSRDDPFLARVAPDFYQIININCRLPAILPGRSSVRLRHDLQGRPHSRKDQSSNLPVHLLDRRLRLRHVGQGVWHCAEAYVCREQPVQPPIDLRLYDPDRSLHSDTNELLQ